MARRGTRSRLDGPVASIVRVKPQLPHARGDFKAVRFFRLDSEGVHTVGDLVLRDGVLHAEPADSIVLRRELAEPLRDNRGRAPVWIDPVSQPEAFLRALPKVRGHGTYFWCEAVA